MASGGEELMAIIDCPVCSSRDYKPKVLPCGHTVCENCIDVMLEVAETTTIKCPLDRKDVEIPAGGGKGLPTNLALVHARETICPTIRALFPCDLCTDGRPNLAEKYCKDCKKKICTSCSDLHAVMAAQELHHQVALATPACSEHAEPVRYYCTTCSRLLCDVCRRNGECDSHVDELEEANAMARSAKKEWARATNQLDEEIAALVRNGGDGQPVGDAVRELLLKVDDEQARLDAVMERVIEKVQAGHAIKKKASERKAKELKELKEFMDKHGILED